MPILRAFLVGRVTGFSPGEEAAGRSTALSADRSTALSVDRSATLPGNLRPPGRVAARAGRLLPPRDRMFPNGAHYDIR